MKKFLALSLALLMLAASLVACNKTQTNTFSEEDDEGYVSTTKNPTDNNTTNPDNKNPDSTGTWVTRNDESVYVGMDGVNLRTGPGTSYSVATTVNAGQELIRKETNGTWDKVVYNDQEYYIATDLVATNGKDFVIVAKDEPVTLALTEFTINLRTTPFATKQASAYSTANIAVNGVSQKDGGTLKKVGVSESGDWYEVSYVGTFGGKTYDGTEKLYMHKSSVLNGYVNDPEVPQGSGSSSGGGIG